MNKMIDDAEPLVYYEIAEAEEGRPDGGFVMFEEKKHEIKAYRIIKQHAVMPCQIMILPVRFDKETGLLQRGYAAWEHREA